MKNKLKFALLISLSVISNIIITYIVVADDSYEDNDNIYDSKEISVGTYNLTMEDTYDYFFIELEEFDILIVDLYFNNAISDLDLNIYDPDELYLDSSSSSTNHEKVKTEVDYNGDYYIEVYNYGGSNNDYNMTIDIEEGSGDDDYYDDDDLYWILFFLFVFGFSFGLPVIIGVKKKYDEKKRLKKVSKTKKTTIQTPRPVTPPTQPVTPPTQPVTPPTQPVTPPTQPVTPPTQPITPSTQICPECGVDVDKDAKFCQFCGYKI